MKALKHARTDEGAAESAAVASAQYPVGGLDWASAVKQSNRLLVAAIDKDGFVLRYANEAFCRLLGIEVDSAGAVCRDIRLLDLFPDLEAHRIQQHLSGQVLPWVPRQQNRPNDSRLEMLAESLTTMIRSPLYEEPRLIEFWLRADGLDISSVESMRNGVTGLTQPFPVPGTTGTAGVLAVLDEPEEKFRLDDYHCAGLLLLEGLDVTVRETLRQVTQLLVGRVSILTPERFVQVEQNLRSLFCAQRCFILCAERDPARLFMAAQGQELEIARFSMQSLHDSSLVQAAQTNAACVVSAMPTNAATDLDRHFQSLGVGSLLLIPLHVRNEGAAASQLLGLIGLTSDRPDHFTPTDVRHAQELVEPFAVALRFTMRQRQTSFSNIHPAVEWRFLEETERRNWGLPSESIEFRDVYPLYGISDIRGSSDARNRAIQADLLQQYQLGVAVVEAADQQRESALARQVRLDLLERIEELQQGVDVDAEVTAIDYLKECLELYFDYFTRCGAAAEAAVLAYQKACANEQQCVYEARARYDEALNQVTGSLRATWERWQTRMQQIIPHYCDIECTDGIDHMIYAGQSIHPGFCPFHLHSLRFEQLRAVCDCARTALQIRNQHDTELQVTHLVLIQHPPVDIFHDEKTDTLFSVRGTRDTRYEIVKKRIDKAQDMESGERITQPGMLTLVYSTDEEWAECQQYLRYLVREGWIDPRVESGDVEPLQGISGLMFARVRILPEDAGQSPIA